MKEVQQVQEAVNVLSAVIKERSRLRQALESARLQIQTLKAGISVNSYYIAYDNAKPKKYSVIADEAVNAITEALNK